MSRLEENDELVKEIGKRIDEWNKAQSFSKDHNLFFNQLNSSVLIDISRSLAIIADKMEDKE
jgi:hypothetical protein